MEPLFFWQTFLPIVISGGALVIAGWSGRRRPPITEELYRDFIRRSELQEIEQRNKIARDETRASIQALHNEIAALRQTNSKSFAEVERSLGRIEGAIQDKSSYRGAKND